MVTRKRVNGLKEGVSERIVAFIWQYQLVNNLTTDTGEKLKVIFPGRVSSDGGGDFKDGVFAIGNSLVYGDVEVHVKSSDWYAHGHNLNPEYNNVVLHVAMWNDHKSGTVLQCGRTIPVVIIGSRLKRLSRVLYDCTRPVDISKISCPEVTKYRDIDTFKEMLICAGIKRFDDRVMHFNTALMSRQADEVIFLGVAAAMGYVKNKAQFERLANILINRGLDNFISEDSINRRALLIGTAGLLPSQRLQQGNDVFTDPEVKALEAVWRKNSRVYNMISTDWNCYRVRPDNYPIRRLVALGCLIDRYRRKGLATGILSLIRKQSEKFTYHDIENGFRLFYDGYWSNHIDFGVAKKKETAILGRERAREIIINIVLPFTFAWGRFSGEWNLSKKARDIYCNYPGIRENQLTYHMRRQFLNLRAFSLSACQQQGLINIFKTYCRYRNCTECIVRFKC